MATLPLTPNELNISTSVTAKGSPFLRLPAEIRDHIYKLVFASTTFTYVHKEAGDKVDLQRVKRGSKNHHLALLSVSRQIYHETKAYPLLLATFKFSFIDPFTGNDVVEVFNSGPVYDAYRSAASVKNLLVQIRATDSTYCDAPKAVPDKRFWLFEVVRRNVENAVLQIVEIVAPGTDPRGNWLLAPFLAMETPEELLRARMLRRYGGVFEMQVTVE
ncbi:hypothetical protein BDU57DRAFT_542371 [Ampelomyces quisqualis]|uniref:Uncharacterized protein n=1 Tax=Ampelomyces quisqualis TaxID=50730 RepID=A0A6A5QCM6_AMPQU|nr:hypothetical protein BDU57DRAFT_542371 [Ampelomyces quisqualis]